MALGLGQTTKHCPVSSISYGLCTCKVWSCFVERFRRKCICKKYLIWPWPEVKITWSISLYIMWPMYLQSLKLLRPMVKEMLLQEIIYLTLTQTSSSHEIWPSCDLCNSKIWCCYIPWLRRCIYKKIHYLTLTFRSQEMLPSTLNIMWPMHQQSLLLLFPMVKIRCIYKKIHYLTLTFGFRSHEILPSALYIMWSMHLQSWKLLCQKVEEEMHVQDK